MPLPNRVQPDGLIVAVNQRGTMMGNRGGAFHGADQRLRGRHWHSKQWICCALNFKGRRRAVMQPRHYTELFFLDEVTALAAGHRPCFECRRNDAVDFATRWNSLRHLPGHARVHAMDETLHAERLDRAGHKRSYTTDVAGLPDYTMIHRDGRTLLVLGDSLHVWTFDGYRERLPRPATCPVAVLTPPSIVAILAAGYRATIHATAASQTDTDISRLMPPTSHSRGAP